LSSLRSRRQPYCGVLGGHINWSTGKGINRYSRTRWNGIKPNWQQAYSWAQDRLKLPKIAQDRLRSPKIAQDRLISPKIDKYYIQRNKHLGTLQGVWTERGHSGWVAPTFFQSSLPCKVPLHIRQWKICLLKW
jgi:hypothetical protein